MRIDLPASLQRRTRILGLAASAATAAVLAAVVLAPPSATAQVDAIGSVTPSTATVVYGDDWTAQYSIEVLISNPSGDPAEDQRTVQFAVTSLPAGVNASFGPQSATSATPHNLVPTTLFASPDGVGPSTGTYTISYSATDSGDGTSVTGSVTLQVNPRPVTGAFSVANKAYDGTTEATITGRTLSGVLTADVAQVQLSGGTASFPSAQVSSSVSLTLTDASLTGARAANYTLAAGTISTSADITARPLTIGGSFVAADKVYDGSLSATATSHNLTLVDVVGGETLEYSSPQFAFDTKGVATTKTVQVTNVTITGATAGNYTLDLTGAPTATATITAKAVTGTFTVANKAYDGTTEATVLIRTLEGAVPTDAVAFSGGTATFASSAVGNNKAVTLTGASLSGADAGNYTLQTVSQVTANITKRLLTLSVTAASKVYDGTSSVTLTPQTSGIVAGDTASIQFATAAFNNPNVGTGKTVSFSGASLSGASAGNYQLSATSGTVSASITVRPIRVGGSFTVQDKTFDGTTAATLKASSLTLAGVSGVAASGPVSGQSLSLGNLELRFASSASEVGKSVTIFAATLQGTTASNYQLSLDGAPTATASILPSGQAAGSGPANQNPSNATDADSGAGSGSTGSGSDEADDQQVADGEVLGDDTAQEVRDFLPSDALRQGRGQQGTQEAASGQPEQAQVSSIPAAPAQRSRWPLVATFGLLLSAAGAAGVLIQRRRAR